MKTKTVLFDFDGVIGMTMEDNYKAWAKAFRTVNIEMDKKDYFLHEGLNTRGVAIRELQKNNISISNVEKLVKLKEQYYLESNNFSFYPGIKELIIFLKSSYKLGVVSGAGILRLKKTVPLDFLNHFDIVISGDDIQYPKPDPEPYLTALKRLAISATECIVIENAPLGIKSAKAAGLKTVAICTTLSREDLADADLILDGVTQLKDFFLSIEINK